MDGKQEIITYLEQKPETLQQIAIRIMEIINFSHPDIKAAMKCGQPIFALNGDFHHWICSVQVLKKKVSLTFHFGGLLSDEKNRLIAGTRKFLRKIEYDSLDSIDEEEIKSFIQKAVEKLPFFKENWGELNKKD